MNLVAEIFKTLLSVLLFLGFVAAFVAGVIIYNNTGDGIAAIGMVIVGSTLNIFLFGFIAILVQNNQLLGQIARSLAAEDTNAPRNHNRDNPPAVSSEAQSFIDQFPVRKP